MNVLGLLVVGCCLLGATAATAQVRVPAGSESVIRLDSIPRVVARPELTPRPIQPAKTHVGFLGLLVTTEGDSVASASITLERAEPPFLKRFAEYLANAGYMSLGPWGAEAPDPVPRRPGEFHIEMNYVHRLRVTLGSSERMGWMLIDDILTGRADSRVVNAEYVLFFASSIVDLRGALGNTPGAVGPGPAGPPIVWLSSTSFESISSSETLVLEQKADSVFQVTPRARVR
jgi:hypothetical protein